jgi:peptide/nickel transport system substrate-binding protein
MCVLALVVMAGACNSAPSPSPSPSPNAQLEALRGGTLRVGMDIASHEEFQLDVAADPPRFNHVWDPSTTWAQEPFELFRCCLLRTLMSYNGLPTNEGGAELRPDLAADFPLISADGLTWTFTLKEGLTYAPPMADVPITSTDVIRALERALRPDPFRLADQPPHPFGPYANYFAEVIAGADEYGAGEVSTISGLEAQDDRTLAIHLKQPAGDLGARLAMPAAAPIPSGAAVGHDAGYGPFLVASGPYMIQGAESLNPALPPDQQPRVSGYIPGTSLTLVRNPSWDRSQDNLRAAYPDQIEVHQYDDYDVELQALKNDEVDVPLSLRLDVADLTELRADVGMSSRIHTTPTAAADYIFMNLAVPPFDDVHVRRAVNLVTDRQAIVDFLHPDGRVLHHAIPDAFENGLLADYNPYATADDSGSLERAMAEMRLSRYDTDQDGTCDDAACQGIYVPVFDDRPEVGLAADSFATDVGELGIQLDVERTSVDDIFGYWFDLSNHAPLLFTFGWGSDYLNGSSWFGPLATGPAIGTDAGGNFSLIGATDQQLADLGYSTAGVPSLDGPISACVGRTGASQFECWAQVDQYLMERVVPWVPINNRQLSWLTSSKVIRSSVDAALVMPALDQFAVIHEP